MVGRYIGHRAPNKRGAIVSRYYQGARDMERHARCQNGVNCTGPGCRVITGKTVRKQNFSRSHPNKRNVGDTLTSPKKRKQ